VAQVLRLLPPSEDPAVLVDAVSRDDAAVYRLDAERCLIATVDFFTPIVDDAASWGAIAAANALSDVYAMGGRPLFALNLVGWPRNTLPFDLLADAIRGASEVMGRARCPMVGGHSIDDPEPKLGMAVIGEAHPDRLLTNAAGRPGDLLVLTKPIGTGILTTAAKREAPGSVDLEAAIRSMTTLNEGAMRAALAAEVRCATDVTGFGLLGHLSHIVMASDCGAEVAFEAVPMFEGVRALAERDMIPGGTRRNLEAARAEWDSDLSESERLMLSDAQTSGGLLLAVPADRWPALESALRANGALAAAAIGRLTLPGGIVVRRSLPGLPGGAR
jgi:selenide,water dikinase